MAQKSDKPKKLSYKAQHELNALPQQINVLEKAIDDLQSIMGHADFYTQDSSVITGEQNKMTELTMRLEQAYAKWEELELLK